MGAGDQISTQPKKAPIVAEFLNHLANKKALIQEQIAQECFDLLSPGKKSPFSKDELVNLAQRQLREIDHMTKLVNVAGEDPDVQDIIVELNDLYSDMHSSIDTGLDERFSQEDLTCTDVDSVYAKQKELYEKLVIKVEGKDGIEKKAVVSVFTDMLKEYTKDDALDALFQGSPEASRKMLLVTIEYYYDAFDQVMSLPKKQRDMKVAQIEKKLLFFKAISDKKTRKEWVAQFKKKAQELESGKTGDKFRDMIYRGKNLLQDGVASVLTTFLGGSDESIVVWMHQKAVELERTLSRPCKADDPEVLKALEEELMAHLDQIGYNIDPEYIDNALLTCMAIKSLPENQLKDSDKENFMRTYKDFLYKVVLPIQEDIIEVNAEIMQQSYVLSHGEEGSKFEPDSIAEGVVMVKGRDAYRALQVFSPFGILLPNKTKLKPFKERFEEYEKGLTAEMKEGMSIVVPDSKLIIKFVKGWDNFTQEQKENYFRVHGHGGVEDVQIQSEWDTGFWKEHPLLSLGVQSTIGYGVLAEGIPAAAYQGLRLTGWAGSKVPIVGRLLPKVPASMPKWFKGAGRIVGQVALGYMIGDWINGKMLDWMDSSLQEDIKAASEKYELAKNWPQELKDEIKFRIFRNEIQKRRGYFQGTGYDLDQFDMPWTHQAFLGNLDDGDSFLWLRDTMKETGAFREAMIATNWQLNILGIENFKLSD